MSNLIHMIVPGQTPPFGVDFERGLPRVPVVGDDGKWRPRPLDQDSYQIIQSPLQRFSEMAYRCLDQRRDQRECGIFSFGEQFDSLSLSVGEFINEGMLFQRLQHLNSKRPLLEQGLIIDEALLFSAKIFKDLGTQRPTRQAYPNSTQDLNEFRRQLIRHFIKMTIEALINLLKLLTEKSFSKEDFYRAFDDIIKPPKKTCFGGSAYAVEEIISDGYDLVASPRKKDSSPSMTEDMRLLKYYRYLLAGSMKMDDVLRKLLPEQEDLIASWQGVQLFMDGEIILQRSARVHDVRVTFPLLKLVHAQFWDESFPELKPLPLGFVEFLNDLRAANAQCG